MDDDGDGDNKAKIRVKNGKKEKETDENEDGDVVIPMTTGLRQRRVSGDSHDTTTTTADGDENPDPLIDQRESALIQKFIIYVERMRGGMQIQTRQDLFTNIIDPTGFVFDHRRDTDLKSNFYIITDNNPLYKLMVYHAPQRWRWEKNSFIKYHNEINNEDEDGGNGSGSGSGVTVIASQVISAMQSFVNAFNHKPPQVNHPPISSAYMLHLVEKEYLDTIIDVVYEIIVSAKTTHKNGGAATATTNTTMTTTTTKM